MLGVCGEGRRIVAVLSLLFLLVGALCPSNIEKSYQDGYQIVTVHTHGDFIVLLHWEIRLPAHAPISHTVTILYCTGWYNSTNQSFHYPINAKHQDR